MKDQLQNITVSGDEGSSRLDRVLAFHCPGVSRSRLKALILAGNVTKTDAKAENAKGAAVIRDPAYHVAAGETITIDMPPLASPAPAAEPIPLDIVFEDEDILVINKPRGLVVHPGAGNEGGTLVNALIAHCGDRLSRLGDAGRPGIVHRLDKDTTGLLVVAKSDLAHRKLSAQFADHGRTGPLRRGYQAFVWDVPNRPYGTIEAPIDRHPRAREKMAVRSEGREAITHWQILEQYTGTHGGPVAALIACELETGRTHQIRVHLAHINHPLLGDTTYGPGFKTKASQLGPKSQAALAGLGRQALHAYLLAIEHPRTGEEMVWESALPDDLTQLQAQLRVTG